jgi:hypothetical protein
VIHFCSFLVDNGSIISVLLFYAIDSDDSSVGAWALAWDVPNGLESWVFEDCAHEIVMSRFWQGAGFVDIVRADPSLLPGDFLGQEACLLEPPAKALGDLGQPLVAPLPPLKESDLHQISSTVIL